MRNTRMNQMHTRIGEIQEVVHEEKVLHISTKCINFLVIHYLRTYI